MTMTSLRSPILFAAMLALSAAATSMAQTSDDERAVELYWEGIELQESGDTVQARDRFSESCQLGDRFGCQQAAPMWSIGEGGASDLAIARDMFRRMCTLDSELGCLAARLIAGGASLAAQAITVEGQRLSEEGDTGGDYLLLACRLNHTPACLAYARGLGGPTPHFDHEGYIAACNRISMGICSIPESAFTEYRNNPEAVWAFTRACDLGSGDGCLELGDLLNPTSLFGAPSTPENWRGAISAFQRACDEHQLADGCERHRQLVEHARNPDAAPALAPLDCAVALYLVSTDGPQFQARAIAEARTAVQAHIAANGGDQLQLENQVVAAARTRLQALQSGAQSPDAVRRDVQACRRQFGFQP